MEYEFTWRDYAQLLRRRWAWVLGITMLLTLIAGVITLTIQPTYESTAQLAVATTGGDLVLSPPTQQLTILQSSAVASRTLQLLGTFGEGESTSTLSRKVRVINDAQDRSIIRITAQANTPQRAAAIANRWAEAGIEVATRRLTGEALETRQKKTEIALEQFRESNDRLVQYARSKGLGGYEVAILEASRGITWSLPLNQASSGLPNLSEAQRADLDRLLRERSIAESVYAEFAKEEQESRIMAKIIPSNLLLLVAAVEPGTPTQPRLPQNLGIGAVLGLVLGVVAAFAVDHFSKSSTRLPDLVKR